MLNLAIAAAKAASDILMENFGKIRASDIREKSKNDFLTFVDERTETEIINIIRDSYPSHTILAEESGHQRENSDYEWIIDPLDGTKNYISGIPIFAVSIGLRYQDKMQLGVITDPFKNDIYYAEREKGAYFNGDKISVSRTENIENSLLATGFPFKFKEQLPAYINSFQKLFQHCSGIRRMGAAAIDLAYIAAGRFDGFWELGLNSWDMAAGVIIIKEAGGKITDFWGGDDYLFGGHVVASNGLIHEQMLDHIKPHFPQSN
jgi:myo-inositol-1(or 4)-monophosphatase